MKELAILDELYLSNAFNEFLDLLSVNYRMHIKEGVIDKANAALITRPKTANSACSIHDECSIIVITEEHELVIKSISRIYPFRAKFCPLVFSKNTRPTAEPPVYVEEKLLGIHVAVSKYNDCHVISTENSLNGESPLTGSSTQTVASFVKKEIKSVQPNKGLDALFNNPHFAPYTWVFQIAPSKYNTHKLVLLAIINMDNGEELHRHQVDNLATYFRFKRPNKVTIYKESQIEDAIDVLLRSNPDMTDIILNNGSGDRGQLPIGANKYLGLYQNGSRKEILSIARCVMGNIKVTDIHTVELVKLLEDTMHKLQKEATNLYIKHEGLRTRKTFARYINHHPMAKVLYALRDNKIEKVEELIDVLNPLEFIKMIGNVDSHSLYKVITNYKENTCQQKQ